MGSIPESRSKRHFLGLNEIHFSVYKVLSKLRKEFIIMSHEVRYGIYDENVDKGYVQSYWDEYVSHEDWQEGCTGLHKKIRWIDHICDTDEEATAYIEQHDSGWYDQLAVKFRDTSSIPKNSATKEKLEKQIASYKSKNGRIRQGSLHCKPKGNIYQLSIL